MTPESTATPQPEPVTLRCSRCGAAISEDDATYCNLAPCQNTCLCEDCTGPHYDAH